MTTKHFYHRVLWLLTPLLTLLNIDAVASSPESVSISSYASANSWSNGTSYRTVTMGTVTVTAHDNGGKDTGSNTGKYNSIDNSWRIYESESSYIEIDAGSGNELTSFTITFTADNKGTFSYGGSAIASGTAKSVASGNRTITTGTVGHSSGSSSGKIYITAISVSYTSSCTSINPSVTYTATTLFKDGTATVSSITGNTGSATVTYSTSNSTVLSVNSSTGAVTAGQAGTAKITASFAATGGYCAKDVEIDFTVRYQVKWSVAGDDTYDTGSPTTYIGTHNTKVTTLPTAPTSSDCGGSKEFVGWTNAEYAEDDNPPSPLFTTASSSPNVTNNVTYYAVFATNEGTGGDPTFARYQLITSAPSDWSGTYVISTGTYTATGVYSSSSLTCSEWTPGTTEATGKEFVIAKIGETSTYSIKKGSTYYGYSGSKTDLVSDTDGPNNSNPTTAAKYAWQLSTSGIISNHTDSRQLAGNDDDAPTAIKAYATSNIPSSYVPVKLYKRIEEAATSYSAYATSCETCETDPTIGDASNSAVTSATATVSCSDGIDIGDCDITEYGFYYGTTSGVTKSNATKHKVSDDGDSPFDDDVSSFSWNMTSLDANTHYYVAAYAVVNGVTYMGDETDFTTCKADAPNHVDITPTVEAGNYGYRYTIGETIKLTATAYSSAGTVSPIAAANITGYQWQKYKGSAFVDIEDGLDATDGGTFSGTNSANLQISGCTTSNVGSYRCVISTGASCSTESSGYMVYVYTLNGNYYGEDWEENAITWTGEKTGTVTLSLNASSTYMFKVKDNDTKSYGREANNFIIEPWQQDCNTNNQDIRLFTGPAGTYTFTIDITNAQAGTPVANVKVDYPDVTHPVTGYMYVPKWWTCYPHWWDGSGNVLTSNGSDPAITKYTTICGEDYWYMPVLDNYVNVAVKDNATWASASNNSGNQTTTDHSGMMLTNDGSWKWQSFTTYTITYAKGDGTGDAMATSSGICPSADQDLTANSYTAPSHKHFSGWKTNTALTYVAYGDDDDGTHEVAVAVNGIVPDRAKIKKVGGNITLTAQWAYNTTTVTLKKNGGTGNNQTVLATYGSAMPLTTTSDVAIAVHTKAGYALLGYWDTDASTGGNQYYSYDGSTLSSYANWDKDDASIDLYARWEEKVDQFIDDLHETSGYTSASPHEESGAGYTMPGPLANGDKNTGNDCRKAHYVFVGWVISGGQNANGTIKGTPKIWQPGESNNASGATYYAVWAEDVE